MSKSKREAKIKFWRKVQDNPLIDPSNVTPAEAAEIAGEPQLKIWLKDDSYRVWFFDDKALDNLLEMGAEAAVSRLIQIVNESNVGPREAVSASSQVAAAKALMEYYLSKPSPKDAKVNAEDLPDDEKALREYIERNAKKLRVLEDVK
jgi:hypothetical protein